MSDNIGKYRNKLNKEITTMSAQGKKKKAR